MNHMNTKDHFQLFDKRKKYKIAVGIITYKNFELLEKCITSLNKQSIKHPFDIFIVDNDLNQSSKKIVEKFKARNIFYDFESRKGIPFARNKVVSLIKNNYDFLAFIDDDEEANEDWLCSLLSTAIKYNADAVAGYVKTKLINEIPNWIKEANYLRIKKPTIKTGEIIKYCGTGNVMINCKIFIEFPVPFEERFKNMGGSDVHFFRKISSKGYKIKWSNKSTVYENIKKERLSLKWNLLRYFRIGNSYLFSLKTSKKYIKIFLLIIQNFIMLILLLILSIISLILYCFSYKKYFFIIIKNIMKSLGFISGLIGIKYQDYN